jgi:hypothetical protein
MRARAWACRAPALSEGEDAASWCRVPANVRLRAQWRIAEAEVDLDVWTAGPTASERSAAATRVRSPSSSSSSPRTGQASSRRGLCLRVSSPSPPTRNFRWRGRTSRPWNPSGGTTQQRCSQSTCWRSPASARATSTACAASPGSTPATKLERRRHSSRANDGLRLSRIRRTSTWPPSTRPRRWTRALTQCGGPFSARRRARANQRVRPA